ncbi:hypothetical protein [Sphingobium sp. HWE2-09]|uniref:hypothetical protein n=1 Tax=Sphingobium sp. HWE2-09 TaxID=3108390 RepID=UPI002DC13C58|nr:hypothetical protein [Sphingobium sp. HWE2-09]
MVALIDPPKRSDLAAARAQADFARIRRACATAEGDLARFDGTVLTSIMEVEQASSSYATDLDEREGAVMRVNGHDRERGTASSAACPCPAFPPSLCMIQTKTDWRLLARCW